MLVNILLIASGYILARIIDRIAYKILEARYEEQLDKILQEMMTTVEDNNEEEEK